MRGTGCKSSTTLLFRILLLNAPIGWQRRAGYPIGFVVLRRLILVLFNHRLQFIIQMYPRTGMYSMKIGRKISVSFHDAIRIMEVSVPGDGEVELLCSGTDRGSKC
jgi:hypothetical protein